MVSAVGSAFALVHGFNRWVIRDGTANPSCDNRAWCKGLWAKPRKWCRTEIGNRQPIGLRDWKERRGSFGQILTNFSDITAIIWLPLRLAERSLCGFPRLQVQDDVQSNTCSRNALCGTHWRATFVCQSVHYCVKNVVIWLMCICDLLYMIYDEGIKTLPSREHPDYSYVCEITTSNISKCHCKKRHGSKAHLNSILFFSSSGISL